MTPEHLHILQHALGLAQNDNPPAYRRYFVTGPSSKDWDNCHALVAAGLMECRESGLLATPDRVFLVTDEGERIARAAWAAAKPTLSKAQRRYRDWLAADCGLPFGQWLARGAQ